MAGWIKFQRDMTHHWCSADPNFFAVWFRLLAEANFKDKKVMFNGAPVMVKRGQLIFGLNAFSDRSGVSVSKLRRIIKILLDELMIDRQVFNKYSIISIVNYNKHQSVDKQNTSKSQANGKQTTTLEEGKQGEEGKEEDKSKTKRASRLTSDWTLPEEYRQWVKDQNICHDNNFISRQAEEFKDYWLGVSGQKGTKLDWFATWRNHCRKEWIKWPGTKNPKLSEGNDIDWEAEKRQGSLL